MNRWIEAAVLVVLAGATGTTAAQADPCGVDLAAATRIESTHHVVAFATTPAPIPVGRHFIVDFAVCPKGGGALPAQVAIDATMPEHRHGMNYKPSITVTGPGRFRAEGLLFHMPGRWEMIFDLRREGEPVVLRHSIQVR